MATTRDLHELDPHVPSLKYHDPEDYIVPAPGTSASETASGVAPKTAALQTAASKNAASDNALGTVPEGTPDSVRVDPTVQSKQYQRPKSPRRPAYYADRTTPEKIRNRVQRQTPEIASDSFGEIAPNVETAIDEERDQDEETALDGETAQDGTAQDGNALDEEAAREKALQEIAAKNAEFNAKQTIKRQWIVARMKVATYAAWEREHAKLERRKELMRKAKEKQQLEKKEREEKEQLEKQKREEKERQEREHFEHFAAHNSLLDKHMGDYVKELDKNEKERGEMVTSWMKGMMLKMKDKDGQGIESDGD